MQKIFAKEQLRKLPCTGRIRESSADRTQEIKHKGVERNR